MGEPRVIMLSADWQHGKVVTVHNLSDTPLEVKIGADVMDGRRVQEILADREYPPVESIEQPIRLAGYGFRWLRLADHAQTDVS